MQFKNSSASTFPVSAWKPYPLIFKSPIMTSRGSLTERKTFFLIREFPGRNGEEPNLQIGEAGYLPGLTLDNWEDYSQENPEAIQILREIKEFPVQPDLLSHPLFFDAPALRFAWEMLFPETYTQDCPEDFLTGKEGLPINGLVWMGDQDHQRRQIIDLLERGFTTIKLKIGGLDFKQEMSLLEFLFQECHRRKVNPIIRLDANCGLGGLGGLGQPSLNHGLTKLKELSNFPIHSIEQPFPPLKDYITNYPDNERRQREEEYLRVFKESPIPIALDEELIDKKFWIDPDTREELLDQLCSHYLVLKPGIHGGFTQCEEWIRLAQKKGMGWWVTSALESNVGLTAITLWTGAMLSRYPSPGNITTADITNTTQGLGTGELYENNFISPLSLKGDKLFYDFRRMGEMKADVVGRLGLS